MTFTFEPADELPEGSKPKSEQPGDGQTNEQWPGNEQPTGQQPEGDLPEEEQLDDEHPRDLSRAEFNALFGEPEVTFEPVERLPEQVSTRGPRDSLCLKAYLDAKTSKNGIVRIGGRATDDQKLRFYRSMNQWRKRHPETRVGVRKDGPDVYVWVLREEDQEPAPGPDEGEERG